jgi:hypothetical protein
VEREPERDDGDAHQDEVDEESRPDPAHHVREGPDGVGAASHAARDSGEAGRHHEVQRRAMSSGETPVATASGPMPASRTQT